MLKNRTSDSHNPIAIDPGAFRTRIYGTSRGMLLDQASIGVLDIDHHRGGIDAIGPFGSQAEELLDNENDQFRTVQPVQSDKHNELGYSQKMLRYFIDTVKKSYGIRKMPEINLVVPHDYNQQVADQWLQTCSLAGAPKARLTDAALSAFYGMQHDHTQPCVLIDFGATNSRLTAVADGVVQFHQTLACGGDTLDRTLYYGMLKQYGLHLSQTQIQQIKYQLGAATPRSLARCTYASMSVDCLSVNRNTTIRFNIDTNIINQILQPILGVLSSSLRQAFSTMPTDLIESAYDNGVQLCGGGALLSRMDQLVMEATDLPVELTDQPLTCVVRGAAVLQNKVTTQTVEAA